MDGLNRLAQMQLDLKYADHFDKTVSGYTDEAGQPLISPAESHSERERIEAVMYTLRGELEGLVQEYREELLPPGHLKTEAGRKDADFLRDIMSELEGGMNSPTFEFRVRELKDYNEQMEAEHPEGWNWSPGSRR